MPAKVEAVKTCDQCYATFKPGPTQCPYCNALLEKQVKEIQVVEAELTEVKQKIETDPRVVKAIYDALVRKAQERGYKSNYPEVVFKHRFGYWPPRSWKQSYA